MLAKFGYSITLLYYTKYMVYVIFINVATIDLEVEGKVKAIEKDYWISCDGCKLIMEET